MPDHTGVSGFKQTMVKNGITGYSRSDLTYLYNIAKSCAKTNGIPVAGAGAVMAAGAGSVTIPVVGAVPGFVAGALAGFVGGTASCMIARSTLKRGLDDLLAEQSDDSDE